MLRAYLSMWWVRGDAVVNPVSVVLEGNPSWRGVIQHFYTPDTNDDGTPRKPWCLSIVDSEDHSIFQGRSITPVSYALAESKVEELGHGVGILKKHKKDWK